PQQMPLVGREAISIEPALEVSNTSSRRLYTSSGGKQKRRFCFPPCSIFYGRPLALLRPQGRSKNSVPTPPLVLLSRVFLWKPLSGRNKNRGSCSSPQRD